MCMTPKTCLPFILILSSLPFVCPFVFCPPYRLQTHLLTHSLIHTHSHTSLSSSLTHPFIDPCTYKHKHTYSSTPEGSNRRYVSVSLPSPCPHVSLQQISGQRCRKSGFWGRKRRTKVCACMREMWGCVVLSNFCVS